MQKFPLRGNEFVQRIYMRAIARPFGGFGVMLPEENFSSFRILEINFAPFCECAQSLVASLS